MSVFGRLYRGDINIDFVGKRKLWYGLSAFLLLVSLVGLLVNGLHLGVEFKGGSVFDFRQTPGTSVASIRETFESEGIGQPIVQEAGDNWRVTTESLSTNEVTELQRAVAQKYGLQQNDVSSQVIGATWGGEVGKQAVIGLIVFMLAIMLYLTMAFEWRMALAAIVALIHDLVITAGVYAWTQFEVTPATMLGFLTILGYSLYDAVVVFDMIKEVTGKLGTSSRMTYTQAANNALSHTLVRSLNTSLVAILPVAAILFVGTTLLGAGVLKDLALALFVGMLVGTYSSICVATPILVSLKEREPQWQALAKRVALRQQSEAKQAAGPGAKMKKKEPVAASNGSLPAKPKK